MSNPAAPADSGSARVIRVLVVDDNPDHTRLAAEFLEMMGPFEVISARDLAELWLRLDGGVYDVILLDYQLPDGNGLDVLEALPARGYQLPIIMVTGRGDEQVAAQAIQRGAVDYLVKSGDYFKILPALIKRAVQTQALLISNQLSAEKVSYQALLLDNIDDAVVVWDLKDQITFWNHAAEQLLGWTVAERLGQRASLYYLSTFVPAIESFSPTGGGAYVERHGQRRSGEDLWVSSRVSELRDSAGQLIGYLDVSRDITERKQLEAAVIAAQTQLTHAIRLATVGILASSVAHELSNPLTTVIAEAQLLRRELQGHPASDSAEAIETAGRRAHLAVEKLLVQAQAPHAELQAVDVNETIDHALALGRAYIESGNIRLSLLLTPGLPAVLGDARQLEDLWTNLLLLARVAYDGPEPRRIDIFSGLAPDKKVLVAIHDAHWTIPAEALPEIFRPALSPAGPDSSTSLELSLCHEIVERHGGDIAVHSNPESGTTVTVRLIAYD